MLSLSLETLIEITLLPLSLLAYAFYKWSQKTAQDVIRDPEFAVFQSVYLVPYLLALFSEWLHGPYVYRLYSDYGFGQVEIAIFYLVGYASGVPFGILIGPFADKFGRKKMTIMFFILFALCSSVKLVRNFYVLLLGRVLGGISTSILNSVFEAWYIHEHTISKKYPLDWISLTFAKATFFNGLLAIGAGIMAQVTAEWMELGPACPFVMPLPFLLTGLILVGFNWSENYGDKDKRLGPGSLLEGLKTIWKDQRILTLGVAQSLFESSMYIFFCLWTPVLEVGNPPLGLTFASFMLAFMIGSTVFTILLKFGGKPEVILGYCLATMGLSCIVCGVISGMSENHQKKFVYVAYLSFLILELSVGVYYPCIGRIRAEVIPDKLRANIMTWFRVPTSLVTCAVLTGMMVATVKLGEEESRKVNQTVFLFCGLSSFIGCFVCMYFVRLVRKQNSECEIVR